MPAALNRYFLALLLLLPLAAHARDAEAFLAANPAQQAKLLQDWAAQFHTYWGTDQASFENYHSYLDRDPHAP